jgi:PST family polysaccharide transporter
MVHLAANDRQKALRAIRVALIFFGIAGGLAAAALIGTAPWVIHILLGRSYGPAVGVMRVASLIIPFVGITNIVGMQWMLPFGMDRVFNRIVVSAGVLNIVTAAILSWRFGPQGTAWAVVISQAFVCACMLTTLLRARHPAPEPAAPAFAAE